MGKLSTLVFASVVGVVVVPACSGSAPPANAPFADGTRLKAVHYQIEGAPAYFLGWYDSELGVDCSFQNERLLDHPVCFPSQPWGPVFASDAFVFADSGCSQPVVGSYSPGESRYVVRWPDADAASACARVSARLFRVGDVVPSGASLYRKDSASGACVTGTGANQYPELRVLAEEIPSEALVSGTLGHDAGPGRIVPLTVTGSDGSVQGAISDDVSVVAWDNVRREMVWVSTALAPHSRWYPTAAYDASYYSDDACSVRAAVGLTCLGDAKVASTSEFDACGRQKPTGFFDVGARLSDATPLYYPGAACTLAEGWPVTAPDYAKFSVGAAIPLTSFAAAMEVRTGSAQLQVIQAGGPDRRAMAAVGLFDSVNGQLCSAWPAADGTVRCLPGTVDITTAGYFSDEACLLPLVSNPPPDSVCAPRPPLASLDERADQTGGAPRRHIYPIGDRYTGMLYYKLPGVDVDCFALGTAGAADELFVVGPEIPAASFARVNHVRP